ncbi:MAG TPA: hypothetical protein VMZ50_02450, partial [Phycisphaerae bacterium]|nr:hypothetical protein [Phycisphaerae bacterium]
RILWRGDWRRMVRWPQLRRWQPALERAVLVVDVPDQLRSVRTLGACHLGSSPEVGDAVT